jgi:hypothetical protein
MAFIDSIMLWLARVLKWDLSEPVIPPEAPVSPPKPVITPKPIIIPTPETLLWDTPQHVYHAVRVTCDNAGLTLDEKNIITACIYQESAMKNTATCKNRDAKGVVWSTDWGICQINDWFHIGAGKDFPSVEYVLSNPQKVVEWMITMYRGGHLNQWVSYSSGAYKHWLLPASPLWNLKT